MSELNTLIQQAHHIVFLTGAGVSTASGIPDYRSKGGLYTNSRHAQPEYLLSHTCLVEEPDVFYQYLMENMYYPDAKPNVIHEKMAALCKAGKATIITQNIDGLHVKAGAPEKSVVEFHGNLYNVYCQKCGKYVDYKEYLKHPDHEGCGGRLRCDVVLYEEGIDEGNLSRSLKAMAEADLIIVCGTSFKVYPFAGLLQYRSPNAKVVAVNKEAIALPKGGIMIEGDAVKEFEKVEV